MLLDDVNDEADTCCYAKEFYSFIIIFFCSILTEMVACFWPIYAEFVPLVCSHLYNTMIPYLNKIENKYHFHFGSDCRFYTMKMIWKKKLTYICLNLIYLGNDNASTFYFCYSINFYYVSKFLSTFNPEIVIRT